MSSFVCALMGQGPQLIACAEVLLARGHRISRVVSDCAEVTAWTQKKGLARIGTKENPADSLAQEPFDYFFSIVNHAITPPEVLALPRRGAINYHDSRLPAYSGFNATSWAILDGQSEHGITWHRMTADVDAGAVLVQRTFAIGDEDTAFALAARASEVAVRSFGELLDGLEKGSLVEEPARPAENFHFKSERLGFSVVDPRATTLEIQRLVRALDFGPEESWLSRPKLQTPSGAFIAVGAVAPGSSHGAPGTLHRASAEALELSVADGSLVLSDLATLEGEPLSAEQLGALGLVAGATLSSPPTELADAARELDRRVTKRERSWVSRLSSVAAPTLSELRAHASGGSVERVSVALPSAWASRAPEERRALGVTALAAYLARVGEDVFRVSLGLTAPSLAAELHSLYASVVPLSLDISTELTLAEALGRVTKELESARERETYARDVWTRYPSLRSVAKSERELPIVVSFGRGEPSALPSGARLLVQLPEEGGELSLVWDSAALSRVHAERLAERLAHVVGLVAADDASARLDSFSIVTPGETSLLLETFQNTSRPAAEIACIHRLFEAQVARTPDKTAVVFRDRSLTYRELDARANALGRELQSRGVGPDSLVAISIERSLDMVVGLLAILKAGGAYVPLDPAYPAERLSIMLEDSGARLLLTQSHLTKQIPHHGAELILVDGPREGASGEPLSSDVRPGHLAYVIFTSGSTGRPKGVMVEHRNAANFFAGMDERVGTEPGVWLAVTSISFDISVLELFWTLTRGFEVVIQEEGDRASLLKSQSRVRVSSKPMDFGLFYFAADSSTAPQGNAYRLLLEGARFADTHDFTAVWTPERHFHAFGGLYPNPAVTSAAIAAVTSRVALRAGSVVIPLHDPIRVAEEWAVVDNLSNGRVGLSFASGWHANDFALKPENYERRREVMQESIETVLKLWAGEKIRVKNGSGQEIEVGVLPRPVRQRPPMWIASAGNVDTFKAAGRLGYNVLTNMLGQDIKDLGNKFAAYREARREAGHEGEGIVSVMLHTFVTDDDDKARELARGPFGNYLKSSYDLVKVAPWMFPAFKQPSLGEGSTSAFDPSRFDESDMAALLDHAFDRYFDTAGLFGTPERALALVEQLKEIGATEVACLIDFGIEPDVVLENLVHLDELRRLANSGSEMAHSGVALVDTSAPVTIREQFERRQITHFQCTPSMARMIVADGTVSAMRSLERLLLGGEALPADLADKLRQELPDTTLLNMYGPTETTVWSTTAAITSEDITIGTPIANTQIRILDRKLGLAPLGTPGELCIGGWGVVRGYLGKPELTAERFVSDPYLADNRLYRTGDLARFRDDGQLEYIGRIDQQVKVNGYRIELGEIETILGRHPAVKEAVVAVKEGAVGPELVGYVIAGGDTSKEAATPDVTTWQERWDEAYSKRAGASDAPVRFDTSGWLDSYTGTPIATEQMKEWLDQTIERILALKPRRVLEIGCGTGMILYRTLPHVEHYTAVDLSPHALETIRKELDTNERAKVTLLNKAAHELDSIADGSVDLVIINSVAQYFPSADYLVSVLERAGRALEPGGKIFLGDVRSLEELRHFHALVEIEKAPGQSTRDALRARIAERVELDTELTLGTGFFAALGSRAPRLSLASIQLKRGVHSNEMRDFRSDVVLTAGAEVRELAPSEVRTLSAPDSVGLVRELLSEQPPALLLTGFANARIGRAIDVLERLTQGGPELTADELRQASAAARGVDPNELFELSGYDVEIRFGEKPGTFDALLRRRGAAPDGVWPARSGTGPTASTPHATLSADTLIPKLKAHLKDFLPEYMVPQSFVLMSAFPLTPNGKIDRKALPKPAEQPRRTATEYVIPSNELERTIADIWREMLGVERVGRKDNIFDLGASSLLTVEANNRLQNVLGKKIPLVTMFRYPTIESLAAHLGKLLDPQPSGDASSSASNAEQERQARLAAAADRRRRARSQAS